MIIPTETIFEIVAFLCFVLVICKLLKKENKQKLITFALPLFIYFFFLENAGVNIPRYTFSRDFHFFIFGVLVSMLFLWVAGFYFILFLTNKVISYFRFEPKSYLFSGIDTLFGVVIAIIIDWLGLELGLWSFTEKGFLFGLPTLELIGLFLFIFIFFFGYRLFEKYDFKKRLLFTYGYIFMILAAKLIVDVLFIWK